MSKQIIFCADGTWNGPGDPSGTSDIDSATPQDPVINDEVTNVVKLFVNLRGQVTAESQGLKNETEMVCRDAAGNLLQVAKYLHGVGDSRNAAIRGARRRVRRRRDHAHRARLHLHLSLLRAGRLHSHHRVQPRRLHRPRARGHDRRRSACSTTRPTIPTTRTKPTAAASKPGSRPRACRSRARAS